MSCLIRVHELDALRWGLVGSSRYDPGGSQI
eukprot:CAMPEP_0170570392 /NCGR_PEP_ID=MMETSP0224-20130122/1082_1 /TAXON_ID=285029 /ORGANISM="Togula jolla, Strain CCCM 725" /LENGTH=30 /DNA_ID= /DNA_START= /DNA_END= /DNA_ORIENTATION=